MDRRSFISRLAVSTGGLALACGGLGKRAETLAATGDLSRLRAYGYGELVPMAAKNTGETMLSLPRGFEYNVLGKHGSVMSDGRQTPPRHDGMWTFKVGRELRIVRNHEVSNFRLPRPGAAIAKDFHYDEMAGGGTTTLIIDPRKRTVIRDFVSLSGTLINCAGGPTPWGSWISCEETTVGPTVVTLPSGAKVGGFPKPHGYCFEVQASANNNMPPVPLKSMGRFVHEAVAVDRKSGVVYLTEDYNPSGLYRFIPRRNKRLAEGGVLQMLAVAGKSEYDTRRGQKQGTRLPVSWVTIDNPDPAAADTDPLAVYKQGSAKGGAAFARLEGCVTDDDGRVYFTATIGGDNRGGQIWVYEPTSRDGGQLTLVFESPSRDILDMPDNVCLMPDSRLLFVCEDSDYVGEGGNPDVFVRILTPDGRMANFAKNIVPKLERTEFAGTCFSKDGNTLFVNIYAAGVTCAIWGDWKSFRV